MPVRPVSRPGASPLRRWLTLVVVLLAAVGLTVAAPRAFTVPATAAGTNVINDPGFESQTSGTPGGGWSCIGNCGIDVNKGYAHSGANNGFVRFNSGWNAIHQTVAVSPHTTYRLTGWLRTSSNNVEGYIGARYTNGGPVRNEDLFTRVDDWTQFSVIVDSMTATQLEVYTGIWAREDVYVQVDDFSMIAMGSDQLGEAGQMYPRVIRLEHNGSNNGQLIATATAFSNGNHIAVYRSADDGQTFAHVGDIKDPVAATGLCCSSIYELPTAIGSLPAGTLLDAASYGQDAGSNRRMQLNLWKSTDRGATWSKVSTVRTAGNTGGLWEPELRVNAEGQLTMYWSDETIAGHSQTIEEAFSADGTTWSANYPVVSLANSASRPGMPNVRELANGRRIMTYEICGPQNCEVYYRTSSDGADWGDPALAGTHVVASDGTKFQHAPSITVVNDGSANGKIVMAGQIYRTPNGGVDGGNGITLLTNTGGGSGAWTRIVSPVTVPNPFDNPCPNYSSGLVGTLDRLHVIQVATELANNVCIPRFAQGRI